MKKPAPTLLVPVSYRWLASQKPVEVNSIPPINQVQTA